MVMPGWEFIVGLVTAAVPFLIAWLSSRRAREARAQALYEKIMGEVRTENAELKAEVEACKQRDARVMVVEVCFRMMLAELLKLDPKNEVLVQVKVLLEAGPLPSHNTEMSDLLRQIN